MPDSQWPLFLIGAGEKGPVEALLEVSVGCTGA